MDVWPHGGIGYAIGKIHNRRHGEEMPIRDLWEQVKKDECEAEERELVAANPLEATAIKANGYNTPSWPPTLTSGGSG